MSAVQQFSTFGGVHLEINPKPAQEFSGFVVLYAPLEGELVPFRVVGAKAYAKSALWVITDAVTQAKRAGLRGGLEVRIPSKEGSLDASPESWLARFEVFSVDTVETFDPDAKDEYTDRRGSGRR